MLRGLTHEQRFLPSQSAHSEHIPFAFLVRHIVLLPIFHLHSLDHIRLDNGESTLVLQNVCVHARAQRVRSVLSPHMSLRRFVILQSFPRVCDANSRKRGIYWIHES
jgi:hypothetical protein